MLTIVNPATEAVLRELPEDTPDSIRAKATAARAAQPAWAARPRGERLRAIARFRDSLIRDAEALARTLTAEMGKPIAHARNELRAMPERIGFFLDHAGPALDDEVVLRRGEGGVPELEERIRWEPLGVVANISAWNYPYFVASNVFLPALLAGNAVLYKPSEHATLTGLAIAERLREAGVPEDVFIPVVGAGSTGAALLEQRLDAVFFTGSYATGRRIAEAVAPKLIHLQLELGGKDPVYVCDDVDPAAAAAAMAEGAFYNAGQSCCAVERIYVHRRIADAFTAALVAEARGLKVGDPQGEDTYIGPLARREQLDVLGRQVEDAAGRGAEVRTGGRRLDRPGWFFEPTVVARADHSMALMREESFGPVIGVQAVDSDDDAVALMNDTEYGLTAGVYTHDRGRAERILARVDAGTAYWNCCDRVSPRLPWTGRKHSGLGSTLGVLGIRAMVRPKAYHLRRG
ncbi:MAG TPA: aldehyde dehydrogenase family protein [Longimicrobiales bacterium]|nr:aldehyde dehydrogenase family protein [Longimicrobiales bacterium]